MNDKEYDEAMKTPAGQVITFAYLYYLMCSSLGLDITKGKNKK